MPITDKQHAYAREANRKLLANGFRTRVDEKNQTIGYKIREAQLEKVPYMVILGEKEQKGNSITIRSRNKGDEGQSGIDEFIARLQKETTNNT
jgi:threonyl-tRNA synthetase